MIGSLLHLSANTRPDITYAIDRLAKFNQELTEDHLRAAKRVLRYLKGTIDKGPSFEKTTNNKLKAYVEADWDADVTDRKS